MPRKSKTQIIQCRFFRWRLFARDGFFYADGRAANAGSNVGRHSLDTKDQQEALERLNDLDRHKAVELGKADSSILDAAVAAARLSLADGIQAYMAYVRRPPVAGGASARTVKRYKAVFDKFTKFANERGVTTWDAVGNNLLIQYGKFLDDEEYAQRTLYLELTTIKQTINWLIKQKLLPAVCACAMKLRKPNGTSTYCYTPEEVAAIVEHCRSREQLSWLADVIFTLAHTGCRIGELVPLTWSDIDFENGWVHIKDEQQAATKQNRERARATKNHRDRSIPLHDHLRAVLLKMKRHADGRVFHGPMGGRLKPDTVRNVLYRKVLGPLSKRFPSKRGGPGLIDGTVHSFRHFFCSVAASTPGTNARTVQAWLGHEDSRMLHRYFHVFQDRAAQQMSSIEFVGAAPSASDGQAASTGSTTKETPSKPRETTRAHE
jgi:integrase